MKKTLSFIGNILTIGMVIWDVVEFLALPLLLLIIGLVNAFPWPYYAIAIGGCFALFIILEVVLFLVFKALGKRYTPLIKRKLEKYNRIHSRDSAEVPSDSDNMEKRSGA